MYKRLSIIFVCCLLLVGTLHAQTPDPTIPKAGDWQVTQIQELNNCPNEFLPEDRWTHPDGEIYTINFSTLDTVIFDLHSLLDDRSAVEDPELYTFTTADYNQYEIYPNIMTQPFTYRYAVLEEDHIIMEYTQTLALSDCELIVSYDVLYLGESTDGSTSTPPTSPAIDMNQWTVTPETEAPFQYLENDNAICIDYPAQDQIQMWYFLSTGDLVEDIRFGYGETLRYDMKLFNEGFYIHATDIILVIGNGGNELHYELSRDDYPVIDDWKTIEIKLDETSGWFDPEGHFDANDPEMFQELLMNTEAIQIRGFYYAGTNKVCLANPAVGDPVPTERFELQNGNYEIVVSAETNVCSSIFPLGTIYQANLSFSFSDDQAWLHLWTEGGGHPVAFATHPDFPNFYETEDPSLGNITVLSATSFNLQNNFGDGCNILYSANWKN